MSDLENLSFHHTKCGTNYWKKLRSQGLTHMDIASLCGNGLASVPGRGEAIRVWKKVTLPDLVSVFVGKVPRGKTQR